jgi:hypothetical protein
MHMQEIIRTTLNLDAPTHRRLIEVARSNERSASAEARVALRRHLEKESSAATAASKLAGVAAGEVGGSE